MFPYNLMNNLKKNFIQGKNSFASTCSKIINILAQRKKILFNNVVIITRKN